MRSIKRKDSNKAREVKYISAKKSFKSFLRVFIVWCKWMLEFFSGSSIGLFYVNG